VKALESLHGDTLDGGSPPLTLVPGQIYFVNCWLTAKIENGLPTLPSGTKVSCENGSSA
jgi:branched-chain amino acid transport system substrate-binding protein